MQLERGELTKRVSSEETKTKKTKSLTFLRDSAHYAEISTCKQKLCTIHDLLFPRLTNKNTPTLVT